MIASSVEQIAPVPAALNVALKEWAVTLRALREGRQILLLRKGGILDPGGEFDVVARDVLLFPTYLHEDEQSGSLQPCYGAWLREENRRRPSEETVRFDAWARITDVVLIHDPQALYRLSSQHIFSDAFLRRRIEIEPQRPLYALFLRAYALAQPLELPMEPDYYGCKSWIDIAGSLSTAGSVSCLSDNTYNERVRVTRRMLSGDAG